MNFASPAFMAVFIPALVLLYYAVNHRTWRNSILLIASLGLYSLGRPVVALYMLVLTLATYITALLIKWATKASQARQALAVAVIVNMGSMLAAYWVIPKSYTAPLYRTSFVFPFVLVVYTLQAHSYLVDVYRKVVPAETNYFRLLLCLTLFPQLAAGPIVRYSDMFQQIRHRRETLRRFLAGFGGLLAGLIKLLLAEQVASTSTFLLRDNLTTMSTSGAWVGILIFACQVYCVFTGLSDIAIGIGHMFGFDYRPNYRQPYMSTSVTQFWTRWNMSLSSIFSEFGIPHVFFMMPLVGLWHGFSINLALWGVYFALLMTIEKKLSTVDAPLGDMYVLGNVLTALAVLFGWSIFYYSQWPMWLQFARALLGLHRGLIGFTVAEATVLQEIFWLLPVLVLWCTPVPGLVVSTLRHYLRGVAQAVQLMSFVAVAVAGLYFAIIPQFTDNNLQLPQFSLASWIEGSYAAEFEIHAAKLIPVTAVLDSYINQLRMSLRYEGLVQTAVAYEQHENISWLMST